MSLASHDDFDKLSVSNEGIYRCDEYEHKYTYDDKFIYRQLPKLSVWGTQKEACGHKKTYISAHKHVALIMHASIVL